MRHFVVCFVAVFTSFVDAASVFVDGVSPAAASSSPIDTTDRAAVVAAYQAEFDRVEPDMGFTGNIGGCVAGTTSQAFRDSVFSRVNWYRSMAGLAPVREDSSLSADTQRAALMMSAQGELSHYPGDSYACYSNTGREAARSSNLALGVSGARAIDAYMADYGANNRAVGHRRTILYPQVRTMGTGDIPSGHGGWAANALYVFDSHIWDDRPSVREDREFVAWPPAGYVPAETVWGRWSFSLAESNFENATVAVSGPDGPVLVEVITRAQRSGRSAPESAIVWAMGGDTNSTQFDEPTNGDECYDVTVDGVRTNDLDPLAPFEYRTCVLDLTDPAQAPASSGNEVCPDRVFEAWSTPCWNEPEALWSSFGDVSRSDYYFDAVQWLVANDVTTGKSPDQFAPDDVVTRAQAMTFIWRLAGSPAPAPHAPLFFDVSSDAYYYDAVRWAATNGVTQGIGPALFGPDQPATRAQLVAFLWRLVDEPEVGYHTFGDLTGSWQHGPVAWAASVGVTTGTSESTFAPDAAATRAHTAAFLQRFAAVLSNP